MTVIERSYVVSYSQWLVIINEQHVSYNQQSERYDDGNDGDEPFKALRFTLAVCHVAHGSLPHHFDQCLRIC